MARPKRLDRSCYIGQQSYFITACVLNRRKAFVSLDFCDTCRDELFAQANAFGFAIDAYVLMPDHAHFVAEGLDERSDLPPFVAMWKQQTGWACRQRTGAPLWQEGFHDRVLRAHDNSLSFARYVVENPVRAGLVRDVRDYPFSGSQRYELEHIMSAYQLDLKSGGIVDDAPAPHKGAPYDCAR
jgi:putative transposase